MSTTSGPPHREHLATIAYDGRFWDVNLESDEEPAGPESHRVRLRLAFSPVDLGEREEVLRTSNVIIEPSWQAARESAHRLDTHHFVAFLRSLLP